MESKTGREELKGVKFWGIRGKAAVGSHLGVYITRSLGVNTSGRSGLVRATGSGRVYK